MESGVTAAPAADIEDPRLRLSLARLTVSDGTPVDIPVGGVVLFVGPNNAGKSQALRDIYQQLFQPSPQAPVVVPHIEVHRVGGEAAVRRWLAEHAFPHSAPGNPEPQYLRNGQGLFPNQAVAWWGQGPPFQSLAPMLAFLATADQRLNLVASTTSYDPFTQPPSTPLQTLYAREDLERRLSDAAYDAFGTRLTVNRAAGPNLHLQVGTTDETPLPTNPAYQQALAEMPHVHGQGDGMKSLVGLMLALVNPGHQVILVDEPEAFLHPPQARLLGRLLARDHREDTQLFIGTHSADVVEGFLDASTQVTIVRLERAGTVNHAAVLEPERVLELGRDPLLRYSSILEGLFHAGVVLCEADSDCRFCQATLDSALSRGNKRPHDLLFTHCGGKHRMASVVKALRMVDVPVRVVADLDVLNEQGVLRGIIEALDGDWSDFEADWRVLDAQVRQLGGPPLLSSVEEQVREVFAEADEERLTPGVTEKIRALTKIEGGWSRVRATGGAQAFPPGEATQAGERLLEALGDLGLHVVPVGQLEDWGRDIAGHGRMWVTKALEQGVHNREDGHVDFVLKLAAALESR